MSTRVRIGNIHISCVSATIAMNPSSTNGLDYISRDANVILSGNLYVNVEKEKSTEIYSPISKQLTPNQGSCPPSRGDPCSCSTYVYDQIWLTWAIKRALFKEGDLIYGPLPRELQKIVLGAMKRWFFDRKEKTMNVLSGCMKYPSLEPHCYWAVMGGGYHRFIQPKECTSRSFKFTKYGCICDKCVCATCLLKRKRGIEPFKHQTKKRIYRSNREDQFMN